MTAPFAGHTRPRLHVFNLYPLVLLAFTLSGPRGLLKSARQSATTHKQNLPLLHRIHKTMALSAAYFLGVVYNGFS